MITRFSSALGRIEAEDDLVERTGAFLLAAHNRRRPVFLRKALAAGMAVAVLAVLFSFGIHWYKRPVAYVSLDINPSVELGLNSFNRIVQVSGTNSDGIELVGRSHITGEKLENAIRELIAVASENGYIKENGTTVIAVFGESDDPEQALLLSELSEQAVEGFLQEKSINAILYKDNANLSLKKEAEEMGVSPGKLKLIRNLQDLDPSLTDEQLKDAPVSEIMLMANRLIKAGDEPDDEEIPDDKLKETALKAAETAKSAALDEYNKAKESAMSDFEAAKAKAAEMKNEAKINAANLKDEAKTLLDDIDSLSKDEREILRGRAEELRQQAEEVMEQAEREAEELKAEAEKAKDEAIKAAEIVKDAKLAEIGS